MMSKSGIQYADYSWNPVTGCAPGLPCAARCWAAAMRRRFHPGVDFWTPREHPERLDAPLRTRKPGVVAVAFGGDLFAEGVSDEFIDDVFSVMARDTRHTFLVLTKRAERLATLVEFPVQAHNAPNVLLGTSVSTQAEADERIPHLMGLAAAGWRTWVSVEPMLGPVDLGICVAERLIEDDEPGATTHFVHAKGCGGFCDFGCGGTMARGTFPSWVVCGGESGPGARPMHPDWARSLRNQCADAGVPFMLKQWGAWAPLCGYYEENDAIREVALDQPHALLTPEGRLHDIDLEGQPRVGTWIVSRAAPRLGVGVDWTDIGHKGVLLPVLDGRTHAATPEVAR